KANILMGRYTATSQVFVLYGLLALIYFVVNFTISQIARKLAKNASNR
ncbi:MAG TPA: amino acid ABC transporter permease, partial [Facklamia tabacinasalis]|nr:amino acid ABC transporter permease [Ruoffia tabacinasalis]